MELEQYAKDQLAQIYDRISSDEDTRSKIKNWCTTVWIGSLAVSGSIHAETLGKARLLFPFLAILMFWLMDGTYQRFISHHNGHARKLEEMLLGLRDMTRDDLLNISIASGWRGFKEKRGIKVRIKETIRIYFVNPSIARFYIPMAVITALFLLLAPK